LVAFYLPSYCVLVLKFCISAWINLKYQNNLLIHGPLGTIEQSTSRSKVESSSVNPDQNRKSWFSWRCSTENVQVQAILTSCSGPLKNKTGFNRFQSCNW
jgi:hypothetical protein